MDPILLTIYIATLPFVVLLSVLKFQGIIQWSWWVVFSPSILYGIFLTVRLIVIVLGG